MLPPEVAGFLESPDAAVVLFPDGRLEAANYAARRAGVVSPVPGEAPRASLFPFWADATGRSKLLDGSRTGLGISNLEVADRRTEGGGGEGGGDGADAQHGSWWVSARTAGSRPVRVLAAARQFPEHGASQKAVAASEAAAAVAAAFSSPESWTDPTTGLLSRERFLEVVDEAVDRAAKDGSTLALISFDLDDFKTLNDTHGLAAGDDYLRALAVRLRERLESVTSLARIGGDEFAILRPGLAAAAAWTAGEQVVRLLADFAPVVNGRPLQLSCCAGVAVYPEHASRASDLVLVADLAMHEAKKRGRGRVQLHDPGSRERDRIGILRARADRVRTALLEGRIIPAYQPIAEVSSGRIVAVETLARMRDDDGTIIAPDQFLDAAERFGLVTQIDRVIIAQCFDALAAARRRISPDLALSVNLSGLDFEDDTLVAEISRLARNKGIRPDRITFEITETAALRDLGRVQHFTGALASEGFRFALDDFGIGFSSFRYLRELPMSSLKFDQSYVKRLPDEMESRVFVRGIAEICRGYGVKTVAEGVERPEVLTILKELGVDRAQGWLVGHPALELPAAGPPGERASSGAYPRATP